jgi:predicted O-linked N-acetylglucosamine transferase (SPINDLY family)
MDFCEHPVAYLTADLFKLHDRNQFEIYAFSLGVNNQDAMRQRLEQSFDKFLDVEHLNDSDITRLSRELALDIAIDLGGHTKDSRPRIFSERAAPIQVNYLGYPGTWGSSCMDYFIGDKTTITHENRDYFSEKIIFLPNTYQANPSRRPSLSKKPLRTNYGLPDKSFVFCCFNNNWKVSPAIFVQWMQILKQVPDSVLWLYADNPPSIENMRLEAARNGISAERFVFAERAPLDEYLARFAIADLFLDTLPYNAGTTASDALWAGLPVLTCAGASFAGRMAGSLLKTIGLPDLVTATQNEYERKAIELATDREKLSEIKKRLEDGRRNSPLFDGKRFTKNLEAAYRAIYERHHADLQPDHIYVES